MKIEDFPGEMQPYVMPGAGGRYVYRCIHCNGTYGIDKLLYTCPECGSVLLIEDAEWERLRSIPGPLWRKIFDYRGMLNNQALKGIYRYHELIGSVIPLEAVVYLGEGHTPVVAGNDRLAHWVGRPFFFKNDGQNPSASFKDRGIAVAVDCARRFGLNRAIIASSGNAGASAAAYAARAGIELTAVVPESTPPGKVLQAASHGAKLIRVRGGYSNSYAVCRALAERHGLFNLTTTFVNPYATEGYKTLGYELFLQLGRAPDWVVLPVGAGPILAATHRAFRDLARMGVIDRVPRLACVQAERCGPISAAFLENAASVAACADAKPTLATGIDDALRGYEDDGDYTLGCIRESGGAAALLDEAEIAASVRMLASEGICAEPAAAVGAMALSKLTGSGAIRPEDSVVVVVTGHGLKNPLPPGGAEAPVVSTAEEALRLIR